MSKDTQQPDGSLPFDLEKGMEIIAEEFHRKLDPARTINRLVTAWGKPFVIESQHNNPSPPFLPREPNPLTGDTRCSDCPCRWGMHCHASPARESGWQPIATAPRDGTPVIVCVAGLNGSTGEAHWWQDAEGRGGWQTWDGANRTRTVYTTPPTHWMPLPNPPENNHA